MPKPSRLKRVIPKSLLPRTKASRRVVEAFADRSNMVYFGFVSQRSDDHHIVRGLTVSTKHHDDHYCIGTHEEYDVVFVERSDTLRQGPHQWHILEFDLKTSADLPHIFIGPLKKETGFYHLLSTKYPHLSPAALGILAPYPAEFSAHYGLYTAPTHMQHAESLITPAVAQMFARHFKGLNVEINDRSLYIYSEKNRLSGELLDVMLQNGTWLAQQVDKNSQPHMATD